MTDLPPPGGGAPAEPFGAGEDLRPSTGEPAGSDAAPGAEEPPSRADEPPSRSPSLGEAGEGREGPPPVSQPGQPKHMKKHRRWLSWVVVVAVAAIVATILRLFVVQTFFVPSASMEPTLLPGDRMLVLKVGYSLGRGSIVVFRHPPRETPDMCAGSSTDDLVKRIIGLPGEYISSRGNTVLINGKPLAEPWLPKGEPLGPPIPAQRIPANYYFMMGDNRTDSCDSRRWGPIPRSLIIGQVIVVVWRNGHPVFDIK